MHQYIAFLKWNTVSDNDGDRDLDLLFFSSETDMSVLLDRWSACVAPTGISTRFCSIFEKSHTRI